MQYLKRTNRQKGLTLIESMVALLVLTVGLIPVMTIITSSTNLAAVIKDNLIAANLTQEGVEVVRALRDANWLVSPAPLEFQTGLVGTWRVEWNTNLLSSPAKPLLAVGTNPPLKYDSATGLYNYSTGVDTMFTRIVTVTLVGTCSCELKVVSQVNWQERGVTKTASVEDHLFNWK